MSIGTVNAAGAGRLTEQPAWKALEAHHQSIRVAHLRELFARDPGRGERLTLEAAGIYLDYSKNRITDETRRAARPPRRRLRPARPHRRHVSGREDQRLGKTRRAPRGVARTARRRRSWSTARTWCRTFMPCSTGWRTLPIVFEAGPGPGTAASESATSSTSASAVPISGRSWPMRRSGTTATEASHSGSSRTSTAATSSKRSAISIRKRRSSSCRPRRSRRSKR